MVKRSVGDVQPAMRWLEARTSPAWQSSTGTWLEFSEILRPPATFTSTGNHRDGDSPKIAGWRVRLLFGEMEEYALIEAHEASCGTTLLQFWDGSPSLGLAFKEFSDVVIHQIARSGSDPIEDREREVPRNIPVFLCPLSVARENIIYHLLNWSNGQISFDENPDNIFNMRIEVLGDLGAIELFSVSEDRTAVSTRMPTLFNKDYRAALQGKHSDERGELMPRWVGQYRHRCRLHKEVARGLFDHLRRYGIVPEATLAEPVVAEPAPVAQDTLPDLETMKGLYRDYSPASGRRILDALPLAREIHEREGSRWGPGIIGRVVGINAATVGRYLKAFRDAGITQWKDVELP